MPMPTPDLPTPDAPVRLMGGVRDTLNDAAARHSADSEAEDPLLGLEDDLEAGAALEGRVAEAEQATGSHQGLEWAWDQGQGEDEDADAEDAVPMTEEELSGIIERELADSIGSESDEVDGNRSKALDYYFGRPRGDEKAGRSETLSGDPVGVKTAQDESAATNYVVQKENDGFTNFYQLFKDALLMSNCVAKIARSTSRASMMRGSARV